MKNMLKNKKGFTLVELLAVIVILALLIVVTANTVLPMMNKSKENGMATYAGRVINTAAAEFQADAITAGTKTAQSYSIKELMGKSSVYDGCVKVIPPTTDGGVFKYSINMYHINDGLMIQKTEIEGVTFTIKQVHKDTSTNRAAASYDTKAECTSLTFATTNDEA